MAVLFLEIITFSLDFCFILANINALTEFWFFFYTFLLVLLVTCVFWLSFMLLCLLKYCLQTTTDPPLKYQGYNLPFLETTLNPHIWSFLTVGRTSPAHPQDLLSPAAGCLSRCPALHSCSVLPALYFCFLTHLDLLGKKPNLIQCGEGKGVVGKERENHSKSRLLFLLVELADFQCSGDSVKESKW